MEVNIKIDRDLAADEVKKLFDDFKQEEKQELVSGVIKKFLSTDFAWERQNFSQDIANRLLNETRWNGNPRFNTITEVKDSYNYKQEMAAYKSPFAEMVKYITEETLRLAKEEVLKQMKESDLISLLIESCLNELPSVILDTIRQRALEMFTQQLADYQSTTYKTDWNEKAIKRVLNKMGINENEIY